MPVKCIVTFSFVLFTALACAMGSKRPSVERKDQDKAWRACEESEVLGSENIGKLCNKVCKKRKDGKCLEWKQKVKNFCEKSDFEWYKAGSFIFIDEDNL